MTKREAHRRLDSSAFTWGQLKTMLRCDMGASNRVSIVNPGMTHEQAVTILAAGIDDRDDDAIVADPKSLTPTRDRLIASDRLIATNILRECGG